MQDTFYAIFDKNGFRRARKSRPDLRAGERAVKISTEIADVFFEGSIPEAQLSIGGEQVVVPRFNLDVAPNPAALVEDIDWTAVDQAREAWNELQLVPTDCDENGRYLTEPFRDFEEGTYLMDLWVWFEDEFGTNVAYLMGTAPLPYREES